MDIVKKSNNSEPKWWILPSSRINRMKLSWMYLAWHQTASCGFYFNLIFFSHLQIYFLQSLAKIGHTVHELLRAILPNHNLSVSFLKMPQIHMRAALPTSFCFVARSWTTSSQPVSFSTTTSEAGGTHRPAHTTFPFTSYWILQFYLYFPRAASTSRTVTEEKWLCDDKEGRYTQELLFICSHMGRRRKCYKDLKAEYFVPQCTSQ